jgi:hypothetical protein
MQEMGVKTPVGLFGVAVPEYLVYIHSSLSSAYAKKGKEKQIKLLKAKMHFTAYKSKE